MCRIIVTTTRTHVSDSGEPLRERSETIVYTLHRVFTRLGRVGMSTMDQRCFTAGGTAHSPRERGHVSFLFSRGSVHHGPKMQNVAWLLPEFGFFGRPGKGLVALDRHGP